ncbi:chemotaxis protein CheW [Azoarcus sp. KH32C]|uniref:chemotaxis protein CheW n=1 Tax=Azoarcus sp. KH32C TaxID=748247 RepID=UPI00023867F0|nr:chemotaxis protein CheW [Azoarcus sp. KH32C]BAL23186.1 signal transduction chemotaxis protein [Azoarcus sp. KH32C]
MQSEIVVPVAARQEVAIAGKTPEGADAGAAGQLYLAFRLAGEVYAVDILRIREIIEYSLPTSVPMMPESVRGVINLRGSVVPIIDLAVRFGRDATGVGKRTCFVIIEVEYGRTKHILGVMVDGVNGVMDIGADRIEPPPSFGTDVDTRFIAGMARAEGRFVIILDVARVLSIAEMATIRSVSAGR